MDTGSKQEIRGELKRWQLRPPSPQAGRLASELGVSLLVAQLLADRGYLETKEAAAFLNPKMAMLYDPGMLPGVTKAATRIVKALKKHETIVIYGDYDVDGVTATAILYHIFTTLAPDAPVKRYIPHRIDEGYGLNAEALKKMADEGVGLIVSVDCGITAVEQAEVIRNSDTDLIITDHHEIGDVLPHAYAHVHPGLDSETPYPFAGLCGAGVAYKLAWEVARSFDPGSSQMAAPARRTMKDMTVLAAMGTVADIVPLVDENRALVYFGLKWIRQTAVDGLNQLIIASGLGDSEKIDSTRIGFTLGPRLNAVGRLGHAKKACELLTTATGDRATLLSRQLNAVNLERQDKQRAITDEAISMVRSEGYDSAEHRIIVLSSPNWHSGVVGIVASRIVEEFCRPAVLLQEREDNISVGSARSIPGFDLHEALSNSKELYHTFGGHAMAAGLSLPTNLIGQLRDDLGVYARIHIDEEDLVPVLTLDAEIDLEDVTMDVAVQLRQLAPFGRDNPEPGFMIRGVELDGDARTMGKENKHLSFTVRKNGATMRCIAWGQGLWADFLHHGVRVDVAGRIGTNTFRGQTSLQMEALDIRLS